MPINLQDFKTKHISQSDLDFDRAHLWHPYTSLTNPLKVYPISSASGVYLTLDDGRRLIDGMSSWWTAIHGYNHPRLNQAIKDQLDDMSHVMFGGITHQPAIDLGKKLVALTPDGLDKVFLADSGSVSVEVAMKMAVQYQHAKDRPSRKKFLTSRFGYHGDTTAAMSVCDPISGMHQLFAGFVPEHIFGPAFPNGYDLPVDQGIVDYYQLLFEKHKDELAAFIIEPVVQGAGGMRVYNPAYLDMINQLCERHDILFIADEIATGFGRSGALFAMNHCNASADIMCLGKAMTGGYMTMAACLTSERVAHTVCDGEAGVFMHGPTFMANPLGCAVSSASLDLLGEMDILKVVSDISQSLELHLAEAKKNERVKDVRIQGAIGVIECTHRINVEQAQKYFVDQGVWIRPFRNLIYIMPPYIIDEAQIERLCQAMVSVLGRDDCFL